MKLRNPSLCRIVRGKLSLQIISAMKISKCSCFAIFFTAIHIITHRRLGWPLSPGSFFVFLFVISSQMPPKISEIGELLFYLLGHIRYGDFSKLVEQGTPANSVELSLQMQIINIIHCGE